MSRKRIHEFMKTLRSGCIDDIYVTLVELRTRFTADDALILKSLGVMKLLVPFTENPKLSSVSLSIIANACLHACLRTEIIKCGGVKCLVRVMKTIANDGIQNRACRALGNIALCPEGLASVHNHKAVPHIISLLSNTNDKNCILTAVRTLRILGSNPTQFNDVVTENGVSAICGFLQDDDVDIVQCCVKAFASLTRQCKVDCVTQLVSTEGTSALLKLSSHSEKCIKDYALMCLLNLSGVDVIRPILGNSGVIPVLVTVANSPSDYKEVESAVLSICNYCREAGNRIRIREAKCFELLLKFLKDDKFSKIHENIFMAFLHFRFDEASLEALLELELIQVATYLLQNYIQKCKSEFAVESSGIQFKYKRLKVSHQKSKTCEFIPCDVEDCVAHTSEQCQESLAENSCADNAESSCHELQAKDVSLDATVGKDVATETERDSTFSIHSPSYQELRASDNYMNETRSYCDPLYVNYCSPPSASRSSPDRFSVDFHVHSPSSCSSGQGSPTYSSAEESFVCFSPTLGSPASDSGESPDVPCDLVFFDNEKGSSIFDENEETQNTAKFDLCSVSPEPSSFANDTIKMDLQSDENSAFKEPPSPLQSQSRKKPRFSRQKHQLESPSKNVCTLPKRKTDEKNALVSYILCLLSHLSKVLKFSSKLAERACIETLIDYLTLLPEPEMKIQKILLRLLRNYNCFDKFIYFNFFGMIEKKIELCEDFRHCPRCSNLNEVIVSVKKTGSVVAMSSYGVGTLSHILLTGDVKAQLNSIYTFSSLLHDQTDLQKLLIDADGLSVLLEFLAHEDDAIFEDAAVSLSRIYHELCEKPRYDQIPSWLQDAKAATASDQDCCQYLRCSHDVRFVLDSKQVLSASRSTLCDKSNFFQALLQGHFSEAHESVVNLGGVSHAALSVVFHFLHDCLEETCQVLRNIEFDTLLELLCVIDKYLIFDFRRVVERQLLNTIEMDKASKIYYSSKIYNFPELAARALHFIFLATEPEKNELLKCIRELLGLDEAKVLNDIRHSIKYLLPGSRSQPLYSRQLSNKS